MVETIDNTLYIASKASVYIRLIGFLARIFGAVITFIAIYETVTHD